MPRFVRTFAWVVMLGLLVVGVTAVQWARVQDQVAADAAEDQRRDCLNRAAAGVELKATAMEGVKHAEDTAEVLDSIVAIFEEARGGQLSAELIRVRSEVDEYVASVAQFRSVAERYQPTSVAECNQLVGG